jgi:hypothetical protein
MKPIFHLFLNSKQNANKLHTQRPHSKFSVLQQIFVAHISIQQPKKSHPQFCSTLLVVVLLVATFFLFFKKKSAATQTRVSQENPNNTKIFSHPKKIIQTKCNPTLFFDRNSKRI